MSQPQAQKVPLPLAIAAVVLALAGAVALGWWWMKPSSETESMTVDGPQRRGRAVEKIARRIERPTIHPLADGARAFAGGMDVRFIKGEEPRFKLAQGLPSLPPAQQKLFDAAQRLSRDGGLMRRLELTPQQRTSLRQLRFQQVLVVPDADRQRLLDLYQAWEKASPDAKPAADRALAAAMTEIAPRISQATLAAMQKSVAALQQILTPTQQQALLEARSGPATRPATQPAPAQPK